MKIQIQHNVNHGDVINTEHNLFVPDPKVSAFREDIQDLIQLLRGINDINEDGRNAELHLLKIEGILAENNPQKKRIIDHLIEAKNILSKSLAGSSLIGNIADAITIAQKLFS